MQNSLRAMATKSAVPKHTSIASVLESAQSAVPLKDAVKFVRPDAKSTVWTFRELATHVNALASGLHSLRYGHANRIVTVLPPHSPEYAVLLLAAAQLRITLIAFPFPEANQNFRVDDLKTAIHKHEPAALVLSHELSVDVGEDAAHDDRIVIAVNPVLNALDPGLALRETAGLAGCVPITGRSFSSAMFPSLRHVVHTGDQNVRSAITFRSLLLYDGARISHKASAAPPAPLILRDDASGSAFLEADVLKQAVELGARLNLSSNHQDRNGKLVVKSDLSKDSASAAVAALIHHSLWLSSHPQTVDQVSAEENAIVP